jgi:hypothetical protein
VYLAAAPEYGKHAFTERLAREIARATQQYPEARYLGLADGAPSNWAFLEQHTERQLIDFFHATEYVGKLAQALYPQRRDETNRAHWQHAHCNQLKHDPDALETLVREAARLSRRDSLSQTARDGAQRLQRMDLLQQPPPPYGLPGIPRREPADRLRRHRGRLQEPGQTTAACLRHALENQRGYYGVYWTQVFGTSGYCNNKAIC